MTLQFWSEYEACIGRVEKDTTGEAHCTGQYLDFWKCIDKCVRQIQLNECSLIIRLLRIRTDINSFAMAKCRRYRKYLLRSSSDLGVSKLISVLNDLSTNVPCSKEPIDVWYFPLKNGASTEQPSSLRKSWHSRCCSMYFTIAHCRVYNCQLPSFPQGKLYNTLESISNPSPLWAMWSWTWDVQRNHVQFEIQSYILSLFRFFF